MLERQKRETAVVTVNMKITMGPSFPLILRKHCISVLTASLHIIAQCVLSQSRRIKVKSLLCAFAAPMFSEEVYAYYHAGFDWISPSNVLHYHMSQQPVEFDLTKLN